MFVKKIETDEVDNANTSAKSPAEEQKITKEITELAKMTDSGAAAIVLRDLKKKRSESPTLDPRNASRCPSAAMEPSNKPRYKTPYFACMSDCLTLSVQLQLVSTLYLLATLLPLPVPTSWGSVVITAVCLWVGLSVHRISQKVTDRFEPRTNEEVVKFWDCPGSWIWIQMQDHF